MNIVDLGVVPYSRGEEVQDEAHGRVLSGGGESLILARFRPVVTLGRHAGPDSLHATPEMLARAGIDFLRVTRGGDVTCHFPDQWVMYPIVRVERWPGGLHGFFHDLEECIIRVLSRFALQGERMAGRPGVWMGGRKIGSMGIAVKRWVSRHGLSLNVGPDLSVFSHLTPCGLTGVEPTSMMRELERAGGDAADREQLMEQVKHGLVEEWQGIREAAAVAQTAAAHRP